MGYSVKSAINLMVKGYCNLVKNLNSLNYFVGINLFFYLLVYVYTAHVSACLSMISLS